MSCSIPLRSTTPPGTSPHRHFQGKDSWKERERHQVDSTHGIVSMNMARIVGSNDTVRTTAFADNGKTTTLVELTERNPNIRSSIIVQCECVQHISKISRCLRAPSGEAQIRVLGGGLCKVRGRARQQHACRTPVLFSKRFELNC